MSVPEQCSAELLTQSFPHLKNSRLTGRQRPRHQLTLLSIGCCWSRSPGRAREPALRSRERRGRDCHHPGSSSQVSVTPPCLLARHQTVSAVEQLCARAAKAGMAIRCRSSRMSCPMTAAPTREENSSQHRKALRFHLLLIPTQHHYHSTPPPSDLDGRHLQREEASQTTHGYPRVPETRISRHRPNCAPRLERTPQLDHYTIAARFVERGDSAHPRRRGINFVDSNLYTISYCHAADTWLWKHTVAKPSRPDLLDPKGLMMC